jgi:4-diphosphocytidyl-2-C-methyl-D-erythritol kinase
MTIEVFAPAKVNLTLHVTGQREDGYHLLDSLVVFVDVGDQLRLTQSDQMSLKVTGPYASGVPTDSSNLVWRAAVLCGLTTDVVLEKYLPNAAGIGGGSADAAAVVRAATQLGYATQGDGASLGADVPVCMSSAPQRMQGIGERLMSVDDLPDIWMVLVNPRIGVPTPAIFSKLKNKSNAPMADILPDWTNYDNFCTWLGDQRNDLETPAIEIQPIIANVLHTLSDASLARMTGSGATCFGLYPSAHASATAAARIKRDNPDWWVAGAKVLKG